jgi:adenylate cyclase
LNVRPLAGRVVAFLRAPGRVAAFAVVAAALLIGAADPRPLRELRLRVFDLEQALSPRKPDPARTYIVAVDEKSLARYGQWPWPRNLIAELIERIAAGKPRVLGVDILFSEPDRLSPERLAALPGLPPEIAAALARLPSNETKLAEALAAVPTVLGVAPSDEPEAAAGPVREPVILRQGADPRRFLPVFPALLQSLPEIAAKEAGAGVLGVVPDPDGTIRRVPLAVVAAGHVLPALSVEMLRVAGHLASITIAAGGGGIEHIEIGPLSVPTDRHGEAILHFARPEARFLSAADLLDGALDPTGLKGAIVLLGVTGLGTVDIKETPLGLMQGIEVHAQLLEAMLFGQLLRPPPGGVWAALALALGAGLVPVLLLRYEAPTVAAGGTAALVAALLGGEFALFRLGGVLVDASYPALTAIVGFAAMLGGNLRAAQRARRRLAVELEREREARARIDGELAAARAIQMGLLHRHFPLFPAHRELDLYALIEPARSVGGDLYDFMLIDRDRLFFLIADVSGKGVPAALFMAMTKEVIRDAVLRHGLALEDVVAAANVRTAAASADLAAEGGDMMFVTAFAGILDLATGDLTFASAGHDSPFVVTAGAAPRQLVTEGGPPLGAIEDFAFPVDRDRLEPGAVLVLFTDGVTEAENAERAFYTVPRLAEALAAITPTSAESVLDAALADLRRFVGGAEQADDITLVALRRVSGP